MIAIVLHPPYAFVRRPLPNGTTQTSRRRTPILFESTRARLYSSPDFTARGLIPSADLKRAVPISAVKPEKIINPTPPIRCQRVALIPSATMNSEMEDEIVLQIANRIMFMGVQCRPRNLESAEYANSCPKTFAKEK